MQIGVDQEHALSALGLENREVESDGRLALALVRRHHADDAAVSAADFIDRKLDAAKGVVSIMQQQRLCMALSRVKAAPVNKRDDPSAGKPISRSICSSDRTGRAACSRRRARAKPMNPPAQAANSKTTVTLGVLHRDGGTASLMMRASVSGEARSWTVLA
jgi:hypothetical protein